MSVSFGAPIVVLASQARTGTTRSPVTTIPSGVTFVALRVDSATFTDPATSIAILLERSADGGATWLPMVQETATGGSCTDRQGNPSGPAANVSIAPSQWGQQVRGALTIVGTVTCGVTITLYNF